MAVSKSPSPGVPTPASPARSTRCAGRARSPASRRRPGAPSKFEQRYLVDLPGYGYAKVPQELQAHWQAFIKTWFRKREALRGLVVVMDIRHPLKDYDRQMLGYAVERGIPAHVLLTKADKLSRGAAANTVQAVRMELARAFGEGIGVQAFSAEAKTGVEQAREVVSGWLALEA